MLEVKNLVKEYKVYEKESGIHLIRKRKNLTAINNISFVIKDNTNIGILGMNGAGKSTLIKLLCGIIAPSQGNIIVDSTYTPFEKKREYLKKISLVSGNKTQLNYDLSAKDNFRFLGAIYGMDKKKIDLRAAYLSDCLGALKLIDRQVRKMSFGERLKMEVVASLLHDPQYIFLDEPTIGLDVKTQEQLRKFIRDYNTGNKLIFITSHNLEDISSVCNKIIFIDKGKLDYFGSLESFCDSYSAVCKIELTVNEKAKAEIITYLKNINDLTSCTVTNNIISFEVQKNRQIDIIAKLLDIFKKDILHFDTASSDISAILKKRMMESENV